MKRPINFTFKKDVDEAEYIIVKEELKHVFQRDFYTIREIISAIMKFNLDKKRKNMISLSLNIEGELVIEIGGYMASIRNCTSGEANLNGGRDEPYYQNSIHVYSNTGKHFKAFLEPEILDLRVFVYNKAFYTDGIYNRLTLKAVEFDCEDAKNACKNYYGVVDTSSTTSEFDQIFQPCDCPAIIKTSEGA